MLAGKLKNYERSSLTPESIPPPWSSGTPRAPDQQGWCSKCSGTLTRRGGSSCVQTHFCSTVLWLTALSFENLGTLTLVGPPGASSVPRVIRKRSVPSQSQDSCAGSVGYKGFALPSVSFVPAHGISPRARQDGEGYLS